MDARCVAYNKIRDTSPNSCCLQVPTSGLPWDQTLALLLPLWLPVLLPLAAAITSGLKARKKL